MSLLLTDCGVYVSFVLYGRQLLPRLLPSDCGVYVSFVLYGRQLLPQLLPSDCGVYVSFVLCIKDQRVIAVATSD